MKLRTLASSSICLLVCLLGACSRPDDGQILGTLERDRLELIAEANEPIVGIEVREGQAVRGCGKTSPCSRTTVIEIEAEDVRAARRALDGQSFVQSVAQLGNRLHALLAKDLPEPERRVRELLQKQNVPASVELVRASLEDVFVAATGFRRGDEGGRSWRSPACPWPWSRCAFVRVSTDCAPAGRSAHQTRATGDRRALNWCGIDRFFTLSLLVS